MPSGLVPTGGPPGPRPIREPHPWVQMLGMMQAPLEFGAFLASIPLLPTLRRGDGHPVLVMPGFMGGDSSTHITSGFRGRIQRRISAHDAASVGSVSIGGPPRGRHDGAVG